MTLINDINKQWEEWNQEWKKQPVDHTEKWSIAQQL